MIRSLWILSLGIQVDVWDSIAVGIVLQRLMDGVGVEPRTGRTVEYNLDLILLSQLHDLINHVMIEDGVVMIASILAHVVGRTCVWNHSTIWSVTVCAKWRFGLVIKDLAPGIMISGYRQKGANLILSQRTHTVQITSVVEETGL